MARFRLYLLPFLLLTTSCSSQGLTVPTSVTGKVSYRGQGLPRGTIVFAPDAARGSDGQPLRAEIRADGAYHLKNDEPLGLPPGWYRVTVAAVHMAPAEPGSPVLVPRSLLPEKYRDPELSGLACEVKQGKENTINFHLE